MYLAFMFYIDHGMYIDTDLELYGWLSQRWYSLIFGFGYARMNLNDDLFLMITLYVIAEQYAHVLDNLNAFWKNKVILGTVCIDKRLFHTMWSKS